jgi:hypothetical protein
MQSVRFFSLFGKEKIQEANEEIIDTKKNPQQWSLLIEI